MFSISGCWKIFRHELSFYLLVTKNWKLQNCKVLLMTKNQEWQTCWGQKYTGCLAFSPCSFCEFSVQLIKMSVENKLSFSLSLWLWMYVYVYIYIVERSKADSCENAWRVWHWPCWEVCEDKLRVQWPCGGRSRGAFAVQDSSFKSDAAKGWKCGRS